MTSKLEQMQTGMAVALTNAEIQTLESNNVLLHTVHNFSEEGVADPPYVGWLSEPVKISPPDCGVDPHTHLATGKPGQCTFSRFGKPFKG